MSDDVKVDNKTDPVVDPVVDPKVNAKLDRYMDRVYEYLNDMFANGHVNLIDTASIIISLMQLVAGYSDLRGQQKKDLILRALEKYDDQHPDEPNLLTVSLSGFIDAMIGVERGELVISVQPEKCMSCCISLFSPAEKTRRKQAKRQRKKLELEKKKKLLEKQLVELDMKK